jgi:hypothetical protein
MKHYKLIFKMPDSDEYKMANIEVEDMRYLFEPILGNNMPEGIKVLSIEECEREEFKNKIDQN